MAPNPTPEEQQKQAIADVAEALQRVIPGRRAEDTDPEIESGSALIKYTVVADFLTPDGERLITRLGGNLNGEPGTSWDLAGLLHEALNGDWD